MEENQKMTTQEVEVQEQSVEYCKESVILHKTKDEALNTSQSRSQAIKNKKVNDTDSIILDNGTRLTISISAEIENYNINDKQEIYSKFAALSRKIYMKQLNTIID